MGKKKSSNGKSKTETVLQLRGQFPEATYKELAERAAGLGVQVSPNYVATIISNAKKKNTSQEQVSIDQNKLDKLASLQAEAAAMERAGKREAIKKAALQLVAVAGGVDEALAVLHRLNRFFNEE